MVQRVISGIVLRETDPLQTPLRKMGGAGFASIMIAILALAGTGLIGIFFPSGNTSWQDGKAVIVEEETGARFVWLAQEDGQYLLHPTPNFASAALLAGTTEVVLVSHASLLRAPRGPRIGISDAPDSLPDPELMLGSPWTLCSLPAETSSGEQMPNTALVVGRAISQGSLTGESAALVRDIEQNTLHFVWHGHQYPIPPEDEAAVLQGLTAFDEPQIEVGTAWLDALPKGLELKPVPVPNLGEPSTVIAGGIVGEIRYVDSALDRQYYQVAADKIYEITEVQALVLLADAKIASVFGVETRVALELSAAEANLAPLEELDDPTPTDPPADQPEMAAVSSLKATICASFSAEEPTPAIAVEAAVEGADAALATEHVTEQGTVLADRVLVEPGYGAIVQEMASASARMGAVYLVTEEGRRYVLPSPDIQALLGYGNIAPIRLPASLIARVPSGAALDDLVAGEAVG